MAGPRFHAAEGASPDILRRTARRSHATVDELLERVVPGEASLVERLMTGRRRQARDQRNRAADVGPA